MSNLLCPFIDTRPLSFHLVAGDGIEPIAPFGRGYEPRVPPLHYIPAVTPARFELALALRESVILPLEDGADRRWGQKLRVTRKTKSTSHEPKKRKNTDMNISTHFALPSGPRWTRTIVTSVSDLHTNHYMIGP